jgi:hypothetical protein
VATDTLRARYRESVFVLLLVQLVLLPFYLAYQMKKEPR